MTLNVVNLLATSRFAEYLDLDHFSIEADVDFDPDRFPGLTYKIASPKVCALMFRSGRIVITGAKTLEDVETALEMCVLKLYLKCVLKLYLKCVR